MLGLVKRFSQVKCLDFEQTYSAVVRTEHVRLLLAIAAVNDMDTSQMNIKTAFMTSELSHTNFIRLPDHYKKFIVIQMRPCSCIKSLWLK